METLNSIVGQINTVLWSYVLIALLILSGLLYTIRTGFAQGRLLGDMVALITGKLSSLRDGEKKVAGQVTGFQAFCIAVASHVGTGNLAGVAIAVAVGGPGALFWMWVIALLGGATSLIENTLAQTYKVKEAKETEDDEFTVTVEVCPFTAFSTVSDELDQWVTDTYSNVETIPSDEELNEAIMRKMYEIMSAKLADPTYGDKMEKEVHVKVNKDGAYYIPNDDLTAVDDALFPQNQL